MKTRLTLLCVLAFAFSSTVFAESANEGEQQPENVAQSAPVAPAEIGSDCSDN